MYEIQSIETKYKGYKFRSKLEALWAVFFDSMSVKWAYEPKRFPYKKTTYLPDFYLEEFNIWVEIKPTKPSTLQMNKAQAVAEQSGEIMLLFAGFPNLQRYRDQAQKEVNLELSDSYVMMFLPDIKNKIIFGANNLFHMLDRDLQTKVVLLFIVFGSQRAKFQGSTMLDLMTLTLVEEQINSNKLTRNEWHRHLNQNDIDAAHEFVLNLSTHVTNGVSKLKSTLIAKLEREKIEKMLTKSRKSLKK